MSAAAIVNTTGTSSNTTGMMTSAAAALLQSVATSIRVIRLNTERISDATDQYKRTATGTGTTGSGGGSSGGRGSGGATTNGFGLGMGMMDSGGGEFDRESIAHSKILTVSSDLDLLVSYVRPCPMSCVYR